MSNEWPQKIAGYCRLCCGKTVPNFKGLYDSRFGIEQTYDITYCASCGLAQTAPTPGPEELKHLYETYYNFSGEQGTTYTRLRQHFLASPFYRLWLAIDGDIAFHSLKGTGRLLDIGCNEGRGLEIHQHNGFEVEGIELNPVAAEIAQAHGFTVHTKPLEQFQPIAHYNVAILANVLEHSLDPKEMLIHVWRILQPGGQVCISCPNNQSWLRFSFGHHWINWHVPFHIVHFSAATLSCLLQDTGFQIIQVQQRTPALWVAHSFIARLFAKPGQPTRQLRSPLLLASLILSIRGLLFPFLWLGNQFGRGDCLVVTARKV